MFNLITTKMEGKTITKVLELESGYQALLLDDEEVAIVKVVTPDLSLRELREFVGAEAAPAADAKPDKKPKLEKKKDPEPDPEPEGEDYTWVDLEAMGYKELKELCDDNNLGTDPEDYGEEEVDEFRKEVATEISVEVPEDAEPAAEAADPGDAGSSEAPDDTYTWDDLAEMDFDELNDLCDENTLQTDPNDYDSKDEEDKLRRAIAAEISITPPPLKPKKK